MSADDGHRTEIIIVKRGGHHEDGHHGGAWKIAFADFMTAMMALFLVLWLINAANEQTRKAVASYFNPVKLVDRSRSQKGVDEAAGPSDAAAEAQKTEPQPKVRIDLPTLDENAEELLLSDPNGLLDALANQYAEANPRPPESLSPADPFAPQYWDRGRSAEASPDTTTDAVTSSAEEAQVEPGELKSDAVAASAALDAKAAAIAKEVADALKAELGPDAPMISEVVVSAVDAGVLIAISDGLKTPMFRIGSAVPNGELVVAMARIGDVLTRHAGRLRINGHTDGRPYAGGRYDNWRLSTARAHAAYHMLLRGGLDEKRIARISGYADRDLRVADDPNAGANRRIEIFVESEQ